MREQKTRDSRSSFFQQDTDAELGDRKAQRGKNFFMKNTSG